MDDYFYLFLADTVGFSHGRLERAGGHQMDGRPYGIQMTPTGGGPKYLRTLCWQGTHKCSAFFCALRNHGNGRLYGWRPRWVSRASGQPSVRGWGCVMSGAGGTAPFFVLCGTFLIAHDSKCSRPISVVRWVVRGRSQAFATCREMVVG